MSRDNQFIQAPFIAIPPAIFQSGLNAGEIAVWCALARWTDKDGKCWRPIRLLAQDTKQSEHTVQRAIRNLKTKGWIKVTVHKGTRSEYRLIWGGSTSMSMQSTRNSSPSQGPLANVTAVKPAQQREKERNQSLTGTTSSPSQAYDLYLLSNMSKEERERSSTNPLFSQKSKETAHLEKEQEQTDHLDRTGLIEEPQAPTSHKRKARVTFDKQTGQFTGLSEDLQLKLRTTYPGVDLPQVIREAQLWAADNRRSDYWGSLKAFCEHSNKGGTHGTDRKRGYRPSIEDAVFTGENFISDTHS